METKEKALQTLDNMVEMVKNEMLIHGIYYSPVVSRPDLAESGAICGGHRACAVGTLYVSYGVKYIGGRSGRTLLPGVLVNERDGYMKGRPALKLLYDELNAAAYRYGIRHKFFSRQDYMHEDRWDEALETYRLKFNPPAEGWFEHFFEGYHPERDQMLSVIRSARFQIAKL